jgi:hypothetical protein
MVNNMVDTIEKLKKGAINRCRERIIEAREILKNKNSTARAKPKDEDTIAEKSRQNHGLTSHLKRTRGL